MTYIDTRHNSCMDVQINTGMYTSLNSISVEHVNIMNNKHCNDECNMLDPLCITHHCRHILIQNTQLYNCTGMILEHSYISEHMDLVLHLEHIRLCLKKMCILSDKIATSLAQDNCILVKFSKVLRYETFLIVLIVIRSLLNCDKCLL